MGGGGNFEKKKKKDRRKIYNSESFNLMIEI